MNNGIFTARKCTPSVRQTCFYCQFSRRLAGAELQNLCDARDPSRKKRQWDTKRKHSIFVWIVCLLKLPVTGDRCSQNNKHHKEPDCLSLPSVPTSVQASVETSIDSWETVIFKVEGDLSSTRQPRLLSGRQMGARPKSRISLESFCSADIYWKLASRGQRLALDDQPAHGQSVRL